MTFTITTQPAHGTLTAVAGSGNAFLYTPAAGYLGADSFAFTVTDTGNPVGNAANVTTSAPATVSITVADPAPVGTADSYTTRAGVPLAVPAALGVLANDTGAAGDVLTATLAANVTHGTLALAANGSFTYTPNAGFTGTDSFTYVPHGAFTAGTAVTVTIAVGTGIAAPPAPPAPPGVPASLLGAPAPGLPAVAGGGGLAAPAVTTVTTVMTAGQAAADPAALLAATQPIMLPDFTLMGGDSSTLMLPAMPEIASLPDAFAAAARRFTSTAASHITLVDPMTGATAADTTPPAWVIVDATTPLSGGKIQWGRK